MENGFDPQTALIGGISILTVHLTVMAMLRKRLPKWRWLDNVFDFMNYPIALILVSIVTPPWPVFEIQAWQDWLANGLALATLATVSANKVIEAEKKKAKEEGKEWRAPPQYEVYERAASISEDERKEARKNLKR